MSQEGRPCAPLAGSAERARVRPSRSPQPAPTGRTPRCERWNEPPIRPPAPDLPLAKDCQPRILATQEPPSGNRCFWGQARRPRDRPVCISGSPLNASFALPGVLRFLLARGGLSLPPVSAHNALLISGEPCISEPDCRRRSTSGAPFRRTFLAHATPPLIPMAARRPAPGPGRGLTTTAPQRETDRPPARSGLPGSPILRRAQRARDCHHANTLRTPA